MRRLRIPLVLTAAMLGLLASTPLSAPASAAPPYSLEERAAAIVLPALVFIDVKTEGYLRVRTTGALLTEEPIDVHRYCSAFGLSSDGHVATTTHCLQPSRANLRSSALGILADQLIEAKILTEDKRAGYISQTARTVDFTGTTLDTPPVLTLTAQLFLGATDPQAATPIVGKVVESQPIDGGDTTLIKLETTGLPVAQLNPTPLNPGAIVVLVGFGTGESNTSTPTYTARWRGDKILGRYGTEGPPMYRLDGHIGGTSHGGMVVDSTGGVVGMINADISAEDRANRLATDPAQIVTLMANAGVSNALTPTDQKYRDALDAYFGGHYSDAIRDFDAVLAVQANNLPAQNYRRQAVERLAIEGDSDSGTPIWPLLLAGILVLLVLAMALLMLVRGRRIRARERMVARYEPYLPISAVPAAPVAIASTPAPPPPMLPPTAADSWRAPVAPGGVDYSVFATPPRALPASSAPAGAGAPTASAQPTVPITPPGGVPMPPPAPPPSPGPAPAGPAPGNTTWPDDTTAAWPAVTVWRSPQADGAVPPPAPAPNAPNMMASPSPWQPAPEPTPPDGRQPGTQSGS